MEYLKILEEFNNANLSAVEAKFGFKYFTKVISGLFVALFSVLLISNVGEAAIAILSFAVIIVFYFYFKRINNKAIKEYGENYKAFIEQNKIYWRGIRFLIFLENLHKKNLHLNDDVVSIIDKEYRYKKFDVLKTKVFVFLTATWSMVAISIFNKFPLSLLLLVAFFLFIISYFLYGLISMTRTDESKINDLKLFSYWYKEIFSKTN